MLFPLPGTEGNRHCEEQRASMRAALRGNLPNGVTGLFIAKGSPLSAEFHAAFPHLLPSPNNFLKYSLSYAPSPWACPPTGGERAIQSC